MKVTESRFARNRVAWFVLATLTVVLPLLWPAGIYIYWKLYSNRNVQSVAAVAAAAEYAAGNRWGPNSQAVPGSACGRCAKPLSPAWRGNCKHCGASYSESMPVELAAAV